MFLFPRAKGIKYRDNNSETVAGYFSQIGELNTVQHLWGKFICGHISDCQRGFAVKGCNSAFNRFDFIVLAAWL